MFSSPPVQPNCRVEWCIALAFGWATWHSRGRVGGYGGGAAPLVHGCAAAGGVPVPNCTLLQNRLFSNFN